MSSPEPQDRLPPHLPAADEPWEPCPQGQLQQLSTRYEQRRLRRKILGYAGGGLAVAAVPAITWWAFADRKPPVALSCAQVAALAKAYRTGQLDTMRRRQVDDHLANCPHCRSDWQRRGVIS